MKHNQRVGRWGEEIVAKYLAERGYELVSRNVRTPYGEIDIIARRGDVHILVEVKTLSVSRSFYPEHQVTARKREHMLAAGQHYAAENEIDHWQIDVIAVEGRAGSEPNITHFENAI